VERVEGAAMGRRGGGPAGGGAGWPPRVSLREKRNDASDDF
jgi:hypothetical protein